MSAINLRQEAKHQQPMKVTLVCFNSFHCLTLKKCSWCGKSSSPFTGLHVGKTLDIILLDFWTGGIYSCPDCTELGSSFALSPPYVVVITIKNVVVVLCTMQFKMELLNKEERSVKMLLT